MRTPRTPCAAELAEETGYVAGEIRRLASIAVAVGYSDEIIHLYLATDLEPGPAHPDEDEFIAAEWVGVESLIDSVLDGRIEDSKTVTRRSSCECAAPQSVREKHHVQR